jgi:hypothetical protein
MWLETAVSLDSGVIPRSLSTIYTDLAIQRRNQIRREKIPDFLRSLTNCWTILHCVVLTGRKLRRRFQYSSSIPSTPICVLAKTMRAVARSNALSSSILGSM